MHRQLVHGGIGSVRLERTHSHTDTLVSSPYSFGDSNLLLVPILQPRTTHLHVKIGTLSWWQWTAYLNMNNDTNDPIIGWDSMRKGNESCFQETLKYEKL